MGQRMDVHHHVPPSFDFEPAPEARAPVPPRAFRDAQPKQGSSLMRVFRARRWTILVTIAVCMAIAAFVVQQITPIYSASTLVIVGDGGGRGQVGSLDAQAQALRSPKLAEQVVKQLNLVRDPEFDPIRARRSLIMRMNPLNWFEKPPSRRVGAISSGDRIPPGIITAFSQKLKVEAEAGSFALRVSFESASPEKAAKILNALTAAYLGNNAPAAVAAPTELQAPANDPRVAELADQVRSAERALELYKAESAGSPTGGNSLANEQLTELNSQIASARTKVTQAEEKYRQVSSLYHTGGTAESIAAVVDAPLIAKLRIDQRDVLAKEAELSVKYGDRHPQMIALSEEKHEIEVKIEAEVKRIIRQLQTDVTNAKARLKSAEDSRAEVAASDTKPQGPSPERLRQLQDEIDSSRALYQTALARAKQPQAVAAPVKAGDARVEQAAVPDEPISPNKSMIYGGTFIGSAFLGLMFAFMREGMSRGVRAGSDLEALGLVNIAVLPKLTATKRAAEAVIHKPLSAFTEGVRSLHASLLMSYSEQPPKVVVVTSSVPDEGKTSLAVSLGRLAAKGGMRVLLIDADLRHPSVGAQFSNRMPQAGLVEVLTGRCDLASVLQRDQLSPLEVLPVATAPTNPAELLSSAAMKKLVEVLRQYYNLIILDAAPVLPVSDTRMLSRLADKVVYVVKWNSTSRKAVANGLRLLRDANADVAGTVLNQADLRRHAIYDNGETTSGYGSNYDGRYYEE